MPSRISVPNRRSSHGDASSINSIEVPRLRRQRTFGLPSFTEDDLSALSRRRMLHASTLEQTNTQTCRPVTGTMTPLEECDDESIISDIPTEVQGQQEIVSALQKENFRLKLSLHSYLKKETLQNARLKSASTALQDIETRKNGLEKTLKTLKSEIFTGYRNLEKLVSEQLDSDGSSMKESYERSNSEASKESTVNISTSGHEAYTGLSSAHTFSRADTTNKQATRPSQSSIQSTTSKPKNKIRISAPLPQPTKRYIIESPDDIHPSSTAGIKTNHSHSKSRRRSSIELHTIHPAPTQSSTNPWTIEVHLSNKPTQHQTQSKPKQQPAQKSLLQKILCGLHIPRRTPSKVTSNNQCPRQVHLQTMPADAKKEFRLFRTGRREGLQEKKTAGKHRLDVKKMMARGRAKKCRSSH